MTQFVATSGELMLMKKAKVEEEERMKYLGYPCNYIHYLLHVGKNCHSFPPVAPA